MPASPRPSDPIPLIPALLVLATLAAMATRPDAARASVGAWRAAAPTTSAALASHPTFAAEGAGFNQPARLFQSRPADFALIAHAFDTVFVSPGDSTWVNDALGAGLHVVLEFDYKWDYMAGTDITSRVARIVAQIQAHPGAIAGVYVADRLDAWAESTGTHPPIPPDRMIDYLRLTGGVFHQQTPGVPVWVDVEDLEMTCGRPGQAACDPILPGSTSVYRYETDAVLSALHDSGYVDGFVLADNLANDCTTVDSPSCWDPSVQALAWQQARCHWPRPFRLLARTSRLSFWQDTFPGTDTLAERETAGAIATPVDNGADGVLLWGWHIPWTDNGVPSVRTWLDKDEQANALWARMTQTAAPYLAASDTTAPLGRISQPAAGARLVEGVSARTVSDVSDASGIADAITALSVNGGRTYPYTLACGAFADTLLWVVPATTSDSCRVRLTVTDPAGNTREITSAALFSIVSAVSVDGSGGGQAPLTLRLYPSPARASNVIAFSLPRDAHARIDVSDVSGRRLRVLVDGAFGAGAHVVRWDLTDARGRRVAPGVYLVRLSIGARAVSERLVVMP